MHFADVGSKSVSARRNAWTDARSQAFGIDCVWLYRSTRHSHSAMAISGCQAHGASKICDFLMVLAGAEIILWGAYRFGTMRAIKPWRSSIARSRLKLLTSALQFGGRANRRGEVASSAAFIHLGSCRHRTHWSRRTCVFDVRVWSFILHAAAPPDFPGYIAVRLPIA